MSKALDIFGSPNIGLYAYATDSYCLAGKELGSEHIKILEKELKVPVHQITIGGSSQVGVFLSGNSTMLLVPDIITEQESNLLEELQIAHTKIKTIHTALGNNLIITDTYGFYNPEFEKEAIQTIKTATNIPLEALKLHVWDVVGSVVALNKHGGIIQKDIPEDIKTYLEKKLQIPLEFGSLNYGSPTVSGCVVVNSNGMVFGKGSAGVEIANADLAFGFLKR